MPKLNPVALSVVCALSLIGCAGPLQKSPEQASAAVQPMLAVNHGGVTAEALYRLARYFEGQARREQAIYAYREALRRDPLQVEVYNRLGMLLAETGRHGDAIREFDAAIALAPQRADLHNNVGYAYLLGGRDAEAARSFEQARRLEPGHAIASENLRIAQSRLAAAPAAAPPPGSVAAIPVAHVPDKDSAERTRLIEVSPQVFELKAPADRRPIEVKMLPTLPEPALKAPPAPTSAAPIRKFRLEVSNGNGIAGMAKRVAEHLDRLGMKTVRLTNERPFQQQQTLIQYRDGYEVEALALKAKLQPNVRALPSKALASHVDVRLVLGRDVLSETALVVPAAPDRRPAATVASR